MNGIGDDAECLSLRFNSSAIAITERDMPHRARRRRISKDDAADRGYRRIDGNADA